MWRKLSEGSEASILLESACRREVFHSVCQRVFIAFLRSCLVGEALTGRGFRLRNAGGFLVSLENPDAADFAASSARSFPSNILVAWSPGVHVKFTSHFTFSLHSFHHTPVFQSHPFPESLHPFASIPCLCYLEILQRVPARMRSKERSHSQMIQ